MLPKGVAMPYAKRKTHRMAGANRASAHF
ncbi:hypothetical protein Gohar_022084, partial [Gossypium harknessii]|nr:hypothetical protein [Gossypium harknessii]